MSTLGRFESDGTQQGERRLLSGKQTNYRLEYGAGIRQKAANFGHSWVHNFHHANALAS
jgi:hypothetical protein